MMVAVVTMVAIVTVVAVVTMVAVLTGVHRHGMAGQRYGERHRRYRVEKGLQVHSAPHVRRAICARFIEQEASIIGLG
jgi:uncharacterized protein HemY